MDWFTNILDFIYLSFEWLGPFIWGPIFILCILLAIAVSVIFKPLMKVIGILPKYQDYFLGALTIAILLALYIIIGVSLSTHPPLDWMED